MQLHGVDIYIWQDDLPDLPKQHGPLSLLLISNRGTKCYPGPVPEMDLIDWYRCRFFSEEVIDHSTIDALMQEISNQGFVWTKAQKLFRVDGVDAFSQPY